MPTVKEINSNAVEILVKGVRISYPNVFRPGSGRNGVPFNKCSATLMFDKDSPEEMAQAKKLMGEINRMIAETGWEGKNPVKSKDKCLRDGDSENCSDEQYEGHYTLSTSGDREFDKPIPILYVQDGAIYEDEATAKLYAGCRVNAKVQFWIQDNDHGRKINAKCLVIQFAGDGEALGGRRKKSKEQMLEGLDLEENMDVDIMSDGSELDDL